MFNSAFGIFSCSNTFHCIEDLILAALSAVTLYFYARGYKIIKNDRAQILEKMDKVIYYLAFVFSGLVAFTNILYTAPFLAFTTRVLYLILDIVICSVIACIYFAQEHHSKIEKVTMLAFAWTILLWFFSVMGRRETEEENECHYFGILLFSLTGGIVSLLLFIFGYGSIKIIKATETKENIYVTDTGEPLTQNRRNQEITERINQLIILIAINVGAAFVQLIWDNKKYNTNYTVNQCSRLQYSHNFIDLITFLIMEIFCTLLPPWGIYYVYFWKNKDNFRADTGNWDRHLSDFDEIRSELIEMS